MKLKRSVLIKVIDATLKGKGKVIPRTSAKYVDLFKNPIPFAYHFPFGSRPISNYHKSVKVTGATCEKGLRSPYIRITSHRAFRPHLSGPPLLYNSIHFGIIHNRIESKYFHFVENTGNKQVYRPIVHYLFPGACAIRYSFGRSRVKECQEFRCALSYRPKMFGIKLVKYLSRH